MRGGRPREPRRTMRRATNGPLVRRRAECREPGPMPYYRCPACGLTAYSAASYSSARVCPACLVALPDEAKLHVVPGDTTDVSRTLPARPQAAAEARHSLVGLALPRI